MGRPPDFTPTPTAEQSQLLQKLEKVYLDAGVEAKGRVDMLALARVPRNRSKRCSPTCLPMAAWSGSTMTLAAQGSLLKPLAALKVHFASNETLTLAEFRDLIGSARKQTQAILELFDSLKYTMRKGDERVAWQLPKLRTREPRPSFSPSSRVPQLPFGANDMSVKLTHLSKTSG